MPTRDQIRLAADRAHPRVTELWWTLRPLTSVLRFMMSGAHPDDEISGLLAALTFRDGLNLSYACSTRGEGGQNDIGTEAGAALGALRTREMERACDVLAMRMYWHSQTPDDAITDFGFSKSGEETLARWGHARILARFVEIVRTERPDILCPTFLDVPGQHGHHRAMTQAAHEVMAAAADPAFASNLPPWQISKLYLPAWSGAGQAYDDDEPPPPATLVVRGQDCDPLTGWSWERIGQHSRAYHRTQGMGRWTPNNDRRDWPLHLAQTFVTGPDESIGEGLPATVGDLATVTGPGPCADALCEMQAALTLTLAAFPDMARVADAASAALVSLTRARLTCPEAARPVIAHRLEAKEVQLGHVLRLSLGVEARACAAETWLRPGSTTSFSLEVNPGDATDVDVQPLLPSGTQVDGDILVVSEKAAPGQAYRDAYDPARPPEPALEVSLTHIGAQAEVRVPMDLPPVILPAQTARVSPGAVVVNRNASVGPVDIAVSGLARPDGQLSMDGMHGWTGETAGAGLRLTPPDDVAPGLYDFRLRVDGAAADTVRRIDHAHVDPTLSIRPANCRIRVLDVVVPDVAVGYIGSGHDQVDHWLAAMGAAVTTLSDTDLTGELAAFDTLVIGIFALRFRPGLAEAMPRLHAWVAAGGTLVTLYHRPWDNWDPDTVPPLRLEIGQPSLRWRVTDEAAKVTHLADHPCLATPNRIGPEDWEGWVKERGLYFAMSWDPAYVPLLAMADPGEDQHKGALLVADVGTGRHVHCALILHHQMEHLVPGAFRLMANLIAGRR